MIGSPAGQVRKPIEECLDRIVTLVLSGDIDNEKDLAEYVCIYSVQQRAAIAKKFNGVIPPTLLEVLGYSSESSQSQPTFQQQIGCKLWNTKPDFVLHSNAKNLAILDLKSPKEMLDDKSHVAQINYYCTHPTGSAPLGILFNGYSLRVFVNTAYPGLTKYNSLFAKFIDLKELCLVQVASIDLSEDPQANTKAKNQIIDELLKLSCSELSTGSVQTANKLARKKLKEYGSAIREANIRLNLQQALANPTEEIIVAVSSAITNWNGLDTEPSVDEVKRAWKSKKGNPLTVNVVMATAKLSINSIVRQKVAEVCAAKGWSYLVAAKVKGLYYKYEGGKGYHLVPPGVGVPDDLHVAGLATVNAKKVIEQIEGLLKLANGNGSHASQVQTQGAAVAASKQG